MKKILFFHILFTWFVFINLAEASVGYIDINFLLQESNKGKKLIDELNIIKQNNEDLFNSKQNELENEKNNLNKIKNITAEDEFKKKVSELQKKINDFNTFKNDKILLFDELKKSKLNNFFASLNEILDNYVKKNEIKIILDKKNVIIAEQSLDITDEILTLINRE